MELFISLWAMVSLIVMILIQLLSLYLESGFQILTIPGSSYYFGLAASIAFLCIFSAYIIASPSVVSLFEYSLIIMSMIPGYFLFSEIPSLRTLLGVICIISAGVYIYFRERVRKQYVASKLQLEDK